MSDRHETRVDAQLPTSFDVAKRAGVSQSTVSLVLNGKAAGRVSPRTQEAVRRVAQELGYQPSMAARTLRLGRTHVAALIIPDVSNPVFAAVLQGAEQAARSRDYTVVQVSTGNDSDWQRRIVHARPLPWRDRRKCGRVRQWHERQYPRDLRHRTSLPSSRSTVSSSVISRHRARSSAASGRRPGGDGTRSASAPSGPRCGRRTSPCVCRGGSHRCVAPRR